MPEHVHKISVIKKIDLNSGNSLKALDRFTQGGGPGENRYGKAQYRNTHGSRSALEKSSRAFVRSSERLQGVGVSSTEAAEGMNSLWRNAERAGARLASGPLTRGLDEVSRKAADLPASFRIAGRAVNDFAAASEQTLTRFFSGVLSGKIDSAKDLFSDLKNHAINMVRNAAAEMASTQFIKPAVGALQDLGLNLVGDLGKGLLKVFGFAKGGLVKKPHPGRDRRGGAGTRGAAGENRRRGGPHAAFPVRLRTRGGEPHRRHGGGHRRGRKGE